VVRSQHQQHLPLEAQGLQGGRGLLGAGGGEAPAIDDGNPALRGPVGQGGAQGQLDHLLRGALAVVAGLGARGHAPAGPVRCPGRALAGPTRPLLAPRLASAPPDLGPGKGAVRPGPRRGELGGDHLVHHGHVGLQPEQGRVEVDRADRGPVLGAEVDARHGLVPFTASRMSTSPPRGPGTAPFTSSSSRSGSAATTSRFKVVTRSAPSRPAMRVPLKTRAGVAQAPTDPGARCFLWFPWEAPWPLKLWRFMEPAKPLPLLTAVTSTSSPAARTPTPISWPTW